MRTQEAITLIETVGTDSAERFADMTGSKTVKLLVQKASDKIKKQQTMLPGIEGVTDGLEATRVTRNHKRSKGNAEYAAVYANMPAQFLPLADAGYEQSRVLSSHRNGHHLIYKAMHMLNVQHRRGVTALEIWTLLQSAPKCGGRAHFIPLSSVRVYLLLNNYGLWRVSGTTRACPGVTVGQSSRGRKSNLYVAAGMKAANTRRKRA